MVIKALILVFHLAYQECQVYGAGALGAFPILYYFINSEIKILVWYIVFGPYGTFLIGYYFVRMQTQLEPDQLNLRPIMHWWY